MNETQEAVKLIREGIPDCEVQLTNFPGGGNHNHIGLMVISDSFKDKSLLEQHRMVMDILREPLADRIHAVEIKTLTKEKFDQQYKV